MRAVVQRVLSADVSVAGKIVGSIDGGFLVYLGVGEGDAKKDADYLADKIVNLRVFEDGQGKMNQSLLDTGGKLLIISQFTLYGDCRKGRRPSFSGSAPAQEAKRLFDYFVEVIVESWDVQIETGVFQENMMVRSVNDGPVTILLDSSKLF